MHCTLKVVMPGLQTIILNFTNKKVSIGNTSSSNQTYPLSVQSLYDGTGSRGINVLRTDNSGYHIGVPMSFSLLNSTINHLNLQKFGRTSSNTAGSEVGSLSFQVADGSRNLGDKLSARKNANR